MSSVVLTGDTSGAGTITVPAVAGTFTATIGSATGTHFPFTAGTAVASTSGTSIDFTSIPSWVKRITVMFMGVSTSGTSQLLVRLGDSGGIETSGYIGTTTQMADASTSANYSHASNNGIVTDGGTNAAAIRYGAITLSLANASTYTWVSSGTIARSDATTCSFIGGSKALSDTLTQVRITAVNGTDTFDAGSITILYE